MSVRERKTCGKRKGTFIKKKVKENIELFLQNRNNCGRIPKQQKNVSHLEGDDEECQAEHNAEPISVEGRRLIEVTKLGNDLWCNNCELPLSLRDIVHEELKGVVSIWTVRCKLCSKLRTVETSKKTDKDYDSNLKMAIGMLDAGIGESKLNTMLSAWNAPTIHSSTLKRHEQFVGNDVEELALQSCKNSIAEEKELTFKAQPQM